AAGTGRRLPKVRAEPSAAGVAAASRVRVPPHVEPAAAGRAVPARSAAATRAAAATLERMKVLVAMPPPSERAQTGLSRRTHRPLTGRQGRLHGPTSEPDASCSPAAAARSLTA